MPRKKKSIRRSGHFIYLTLLLFCCFVVFSTSILSFSLVLGYAIPAVNCVTSSSINACLEAARKNDAPIIIQFSSGGSQFYAGKGLDNTNYKAAIAGAVSGAFHVRTMAEQYGVPVILHTDHCAKSLLPWVDGLVAASERYFKDHGEPLFSSHMIDLSEEPIEENIEICKDYLSRMAKMGLLLEMELGITGGEEDGVDNSDRPIEDLYSKPEEIYQVYEELNSISPMFSGTCGGKQFFLILNVFHKYRTTYANNFLFICFSLRFQQSLLPLVMSMEFINQEMSV